MIRELKKEAEKYISDTGYGTGSNFTIGQVAILMARFTIEVINKKDKSKSEIQKDNFGQPCNPYDLNNAPGFRKHKN